MLAGHVTNVVVVSASFWEVFVPVLAMFVGAVVGALISLAIVHRAHERDRSR